MEKVPIDEIPCTVTVHCKISRIGLVKPKKRVRRVKPVYPIFDPQHCSEAWSTDFKGKFKMSNKQYCHTLTIADSKSRFLFAAEAQADKFVGLEHLGNDVYRVYYRHLVLGYFNLNELNMNNKRIKLL